MAQCPVCGLQLDSVYGSCPKCGLDLAWHRWRLQGGVLAVAGLVLLVAGIILNLWIHDPALSIIVAGPSGSMLLIGAPYFLYYSYRINSMKDRWGHRKVPVS